MRTLVVLFLPVLACVPAEKQRCAADEYRTLDGDCAPADAHDDTDDGRDVDPDEPPETADPGETAEPVETGGDDEPDDTGAEDDTGEPDPGEEHDAASSFEGRTWRIDLSAAVWDEPSGLGDVLVGAIESPILLQVWAASDSALDVVGAVADWDDVDGDGDRDEQDPCALTLDLSGSAFTNPGFEIGPSTLSIIVDGIPMSLEDTTIMGAFEPGGASFDAELEGMMDTRPLAAWLDPEGSDDAACELLASLAYGHCETCPSDGEPYCVPVHFDEMLGVEVSMEILEITEDTLPAFCAE